MREIPRWFFFLIYFIYLFIYLYIFGCAGSSVRARALSSRGKRGPLLIAVRGPLFIAVRGPLTTAAPPAAGHRLQTRRLSSCGSRAQSLRGTRDPPRPGPEPASPAPAGRLPTTAPPGKPPNWSIVNLKCCVSFWCTTKWFSYIYIYLHTHTYIFFFRFFSIIGYYMILNMVPCAIQ